MDIELLKFQNPWWGDQEWQRRDTHLSQIRGKSYYFCHPWAKTLEFKTGQIHVVRGPRQVGKTTLSKEWIDRLMSVENVPAQDILYMTCEEMESFHELHSILIQWIQGKKDERVYIFLDEVTFVEEWQRAILSCSNMGMFQKASLVITGSNARDLKESAERLPGRRGGGLDIQLYPLLPFQYKTLDCFRSYGTQELTDIYLKVGGFPHAIRDFVTQGFVTAETYRTYRNWIVGDAVHYGLSEEILKHLLFRIYETGGSQITWPRIIENTTIKSHETALNYIEHLQDAFLCEVLHCYDPQKNGPAIHKARKIHFIDPLLYYLSATWKNSVTSIWEWIQYPDTYEMIRPKLLESVFVMQLAIQKNIKPYFWYSAKTKEEVDILIVSEKERNLYEVKWGGGHPYQALSQTVQILSSKDLFSNML